jgi:hypothetical protein
MFHVTSSLVGGVAAVAAWALVAPSTHPIQRAGLTQTDHQSVNRTAKGDRLALPPNYRQAKRPVATVEVIGVHDAAIVYREGLRGAATHIARHAAKQADPDGGAA